MDRKPLPNREYVRSLIDYDPVTGICKWKQSKSGRSKPTIGTLTVDGYYRVTIDYVNYPLHHIIWLWYYGEPVPEFIDHKDHIRNNNIITNLRAATRQQNLWNNIRKRSNATGHKYIYHQTNVLFRVRFNINKESFNGGNHSTIESAIEARDKLLLQLHKEFSNAN